MIVYKITNKINDKSYIGITTGDMKQRLRGHRQKTNSHLTSAMNKYGKENFIIEQIATAKTNKELDRKEVALIKKLKPEYNMQEGGREWFHHNKETKDRLSKIMSKKLIGNSNHNIPHTEEAKKKIAVGMTGNINKVGPSGKQKNKFKGTRTWLMGENNVSKRLEVREKLRQAALNRYK